MTLTFDLSLPALVDTVCDAWGVDAVKNNLFLRDASGQLTFVVLDRERNGEAREELSAAVNLRLGIYADASGISVATPEELFDDRLREAGYGSFYPIRSAKFVGIVRLVDRRVVGADWLLTPSTKTLDIPRIFFVSLKGGVGRSTALCVLAAHLAHSGQRVLAVDLDLEAPGLGSILLDSETLPKYGILDYLVETNLSEVHDTFISEMIGYSKLAAGRGVVTVMPAIGTLSTNNPENILSKIARAYLSSDQDQRQSGFTFKIENLLERATRSGDYDVVLVDARAGLHESTAAAVVGLRGDTLLFGINQPQTYIGYKALFSQLAATLGADWTARIHFVEARVGADGPSKEFRSNVAAAMPSTNEQTDNVAIPLDQLRDTFEIEWVESALESRIDLIIENEVDSTFIFESSQFREFDPIRNPDRLDQGAYAAVFGNFLERCDEIIRFEEYARADDGNENG